MTSPDTTDVKALRNTSQYLLPLHKPAPAANGYDVYPAFTITDPIFTGFTSLAGWIAGRGESVIIDGYSGVYWDIFAGNLRRELSLSGIEANWISSQDFLKSSGDIYTLISESLGGDDPLFGKIYEGSLSDFFKPELSTIQPVRGKLNVIYGPGAALSGWTGTLIYLDVPKNEIQFRSRAGHLPNLGDLAPKDPKQQYKQYYFVEWPMLNKHKKALLPHIDAIVDEQRVSEISWMEGDALRRSLTQVSASAFRVRPWFEPGVWGGQWIKDKIEGVNPGVVNYAWSFELIAPENGLILTYDGILLEVSFDILMCYAAEQVTGRAAKRFGDNFPIRFDFLDTFDGGNLSLQCHPSVAYTKTHFGEDFTQDETYYILDAGADAVVYLGFQKDIDPATFRKTLEDSFDHNTPVKVADYVQTFPASKHDLFLIPNGTVHCSGKNNMVLEISATPYIYTFKMYDWLRLDLNGKPRTLNIDRAFANLNFDRRGDVVSDTLISRQHISASGHNWQIVELSTHPEHFYRVRRYEFRNTFAAATNGQCHVLSLVEGTSVTVTTGGRSLIVHYAETFIIPAAAADYTLVNNNPGEVAKVIVAFVKDECC